MYLVIKHKNETVRLERDDGFSHTVSSCLGLESMYEYVCQSQIIVAEDH